MLFPTAGDGRDTPRFLALATLDVFDPAILEMGTWNVSLEPDRLEVVDAPSLAWLGLADVDDATRAVAASFLACAQPFGAPIASARLLAAELRAFRDAIRERPQHCRIEADNPQGLFVDAVHRVDERGFYIRGWMRDASSEIVSLTAISPEGARAELLDLVVRFGRPDVEEFYGAGTHERATSRSGFLAYFELGAPSHLTEGWVLETRNSAGLVLEAVCPPAVDDVPMTRTVLLDDLGLELPNHETLVRDHVFPALARVQERHARAVHVAAVHQYGTPPATPDVTIVVPLYRRIDFLEHQLAQWVEDPEVAQCDLIYVLDSPALAAELHAAAAALHRLYRIPFRSVVLEHNVGFAAANNVGADLARGRLLLLLNSDVLPDQPGWLGTLVEFLERTPRAGIVGPKLVYEDDSIQHAGMYFARSEGSPSWENAHYFKGLHRSFPAADAERAVPAVTGACMLMPLDLWQRVSGLSGIYVQGDYEDSDLCLRLADLGYECWYVPKAELYHLEGQSYPTPLRQLTSRYNTWLHTHLWGDQIEAVMHRVSAPEARTAKSSRKVRS
jgi:GT2 family glycosyltransferase